MSDNPYAPPEATLKDPPDKRAVAEQPRVVRLAVVLLWISLALSLPTLWFDGQRGGADFSLPLTIAFIVVFGGLGVMLIVFISRGSHWARMAYLMLTMFTIAILGSTWRQLIGDGYGELVMNAASLAFELVALYLIFTKPGKLWFRRAPV
ncbi:MAG: hypothetical protein ABIU95_11115 [Burkholderiales bacterium]